MVMEGQKCKASAGRIGFAAKNDASSCADLCANKDGCGFFHYDPNDGECLSVTTADASCEEGFADSSWYDFWAI